jgi:uncharacterized protein (TIGR03083 family)
MNDELERLAGRLEADGQKTASYFQSLEPAQWDAQVYTTGSAWTIRDVLAHFVSAERSLKLLVQDVANGGDGAPRDLQIDEFNEREVPKLDDLSPDELLEAFKGARGTTLELVHGLEPAALDLIGYHPWFGDVELRDMLKLVYRHNMIHLRDVRKTLRSGRPVPHTEIEPPSAG